MPIFTQLFFFFFTYFQVEKNKNKYDGGIQDGSHRKSWQINRLMTSSRLVRYFDFQITFQLTNYPTFTINASIFLKLWRGRGNGGRVGRGKRMGDNNNKPWQNKIKIVVGHVLMLLCDSSLESESHRCKIVFFSVFRCDRFAPSANYFMILTNFIMFFLNYWQQRHTVSICSKQWLSAL